MVASKPDSKNRQPGLLLSNLTEQRPIFELVYFIVGIENSAPARIPVGQREVMVFSLV